MIMRILFPIAFSLGVAFGILLFLSDPQPAKAQVEDSELSEAELSLLEYLVTENVLDELSRAYLRRCAVFCNNGSSYETSTNSAVACWDECNRLCAGAGGCGAATFNKKPKPSSVGEAN